MQGFIKSEVEQKDIAYIHRKASEEFEILSNNNLLLTGANGFLGYYFVRSIISWNLINPKKKINLTALSTFRSGIPNWLKNIPKSANLTILKKDIGKYSINKNDRFDYIIHAASIASPTFYRLYPVETINSNVLGLYKLLDYLLGRKMMKKPVKGFLLFSSSEVYGNPDSKKIPIDEGYNGNVSFTGPRACYDESKRFCETLCVNYSKVYDLPIKSARPFNNYGPGLKIDDGRVIPDFAKNILENKDIVMYSEGNPTRTFCYVADAIVGYVKILTKGRQGEAYNIGTEKPEISMTSLAKLMIQLGAKHFNYEGKIIEKESKDKNYLVDNPQRRCPRIDKAKKELGYVPGIKLEEGLFKIMSWYKENV